MRLITPTVLLGLYAHSVLAAPASAPPSPVTSPEGRNHPRKTGDVLNYVLALGYVETALLREGARNYSSSDYANASLPSTLNDNIQQIVANNGAHLELLTQALKKIGVPQIPACQYDFPTTTARDFVELASEISEVVVSTYIEVGKQLVTGLGFSSRAFSLFTVKARHSAILRLALGEEAAPTPVEYGLDLSESFSLGIQPFQAWCSFNAMPPVPDSGVDLTLLTPGPVYPGKFLEFTSAYNYSGDPSLLYFHLSSSEIEVDVPVTLNGNKVYMTAPKGLRGPTYVLLKRGSENADNAILAGPALLEFPTYEMR